MNEALRKIQTSNPSFNDDLYNKYESFDVASLILTEEEHEYANNLKEIKVGILDDYLPFSTEENGEVIGVVSYIADCIKGMSSGANNLQISYKTYPTYLEMIQGLKDKEVNIIFPITSDFYYSELSQILESEEVFELPMSLIYRDYNKNVTSKIAVTKHWEMEFDKDGNFLSCSWSDQFRRLLGYKDENDFPNKIESWSNLIVPEDKEYSLKVLFDSAIDTTGSKGYNLEHRLITKDRGIRWFRAGGKAVKKVGADTIIYYGAFQAINETKLAQEKAYSDSINDSLTGLKNRRAHDAFIAELENDAKPFVCVISIDLNGLKTANDEYGHAAGDELILGAAECLSKAFEGIGNVYRMGGDEFEVLSTEQSVNFDSAVTDLKQICENWHGVYVKELTMSIGVASAENVNSQLFAELVKTADERMYADKELFYQQTGRNRRKSR